MTQDELKMVLEALKWSKPHEDAVISHSEAIIAIEKALAQPEQEPVGMVKDLFTYTAWDKLDVRGSTKVYLDTPPQRTWVGLTDEEIEQGCKESWVTLQAWQSGVWWAEARLKQKNGYAEDKNT